MPAAPEISVLLPVFEGAATLRACLTSIARQTHRNWECVVVDDGSSDRSLEIARRAVELDSRFRVVSRPHRGLVSALNTGIANCRGRTIARMDADDLMHRERLASQAAALDASPELAAVGCGVRLFPRRSLGPGMRRYERWLNSIDSAERVVADAFVECPVAHPTLVIRREVLLELGYRDAGWPEDYDLILRMIAARKPIGVVRRRLLAKRSGARALSAASETYATGRFTACKAAFLARTFLAADRHYVLWGYGATGRALRRALCEHDRTPAAIVELHPGRIGNTIHSAPVIRPDELAAWRELPLVVSVAGDEARRSIRADLERRGYRELRDYVCAA